MVPVSSFPLLRLPKNATMNTLRIMNHLKLFGISLISNKTKGLVQSLNLTLFEFMVCVDNGFSISLTFSGAYLTFRHFLNRLDYEIDYESMDEYEIIKEPWTSNKMDGRMLINHLKLIFNCSKIKVEFKFNSERFNFEPILKGRLDIESIRLNNDNQEENLRILNVVKPSMVSMNNPPSRDILIQNFDNLIASEMIISLEDLLISNVRNFEADCQMVTSKLLNQFLKLWMHGSNLQLESLKLDFTLDNDFKQEEIFAGLKITENRHFKSASDTCEITDGVDICRFDGTMATIFVGNHSRACAFEIYVWHDHCTA
ncbi:hypothetical protein CAEBREN_05395 [Caenorhabditis brenneri]|uniref:F-box domain-containing protein n=1 Tax=Caenorhabditis brenneri TaxID=135651 RepID=G0N0C5_CAEBE|nr:hypothetical protein CAEBREN_05395 [Caenorhabditis brenneri]